MNNKVRIRTRSRLMILLLILCMLFQQAIPIQANSKIKTPDKTEYSKFKTDTLNSIHSISTYKLNYKNYKLVRGKSFSLKVTKLPSNYRVTFKSKNESIATVSTKGTVKGLKKGTVTIVATVRYKNLVLRKFNCKVTVGLPAVSVVIPESKITLTQGKKKDLNTIVKPKFSTENPRFVSSDPTVVTVTSEGIIKAVKPGSAIITVTIANKKFDKCVVTVTSKHNKKK